MDIRNNLANRLRELMDARPDLDTQTKVANRSGVGQSTIQRLLAQEQSATIDMLDKIARPFGLMPWELLLPDLEDAKLIRGFGKLSGSDKQRILAFMEFSAELQPGHHAPAQLNTETRSKVPPSLAAAKNRASARSPGADVIKTTANGNRTAAKRLTGRKS